MDNHSITYYQSLLREIHEERIKFLRQGDNNKIKDCDSLIKEYNNTIIKLK